MDAALPLTEASLATDSTLAYRASIHPDNDKRIAHNPFRCVFFRRMITLDVPRLRVGGPILPLKSFKFFFNNMDVDQVRAKYQTTGFVDRNIVALSRFTTNRQRMTAYLPEPGTVEPTIFNLANEGFQLAVPAHDNGSDREMSPASENDVEDIDTEISQLWRQFVMDLTCKSPNQRGSTNPSYLKLNEVQRRTGSEAPYHNNRFDEIFTAVYYKDASEKEWETSFRWLLPPLGHQSSTAVQNYRQSPYYQKWMQMLEANAQEPAVIERIRKEFWDRIRTWSWIPKAESDKMWPTSVNKPSKRAFIRWPPSDRRDPAPIILLRHGIVPDFRPAVVLNIGVRHADMPVPVQEEEEESE